MKVTDCPELYVALSESIRSMPTYRLRLEYVLRNILPSNLLITTQELSIRLGITEGEALILLRDLRIWYYEVEDEIQLSKYFKPRFKIAGVGGTFDNIHVGHLALLNLAFRLAEKVLIGLCSDELVRRLGKKGDVACFEDRKKQLEEKLKKYGWDAKAHILPIDDEYGPLINEPDYELLVVSPFTYSRGIEINEIRLRKGLSPVRIEVCPVVLAEDGNPISSTRIRMGELFPDGRVRQTQR
jgi:pantetheine-phosphate adenylyltransferase